MNERDELMDLLADTIPQFEEYADPFGEVADAILTAGYRKPRQVTTMRELHALPSETVIRDVFGAVFVKDGGWWAETGARDKSLSVDLDLPAMVLYEPEPLP